MALYVRTLARGLLSGDSAEFQTIAYTMGMGHPTGYPVYVLIGKLFTYLPIGEIAYRVNLFSAVSAAIAIAILYLVIRQLGANQASAFFGSLLLAFVPQFWKFAVVAEVYAPSAACLAFILLCVLKWSESNKPHWIFWAGFSGGVSLGIHSSIALTAPAILIYLFANLKAQRGTRQKGLVAIKYAGLGALTGICLFLLSFFYIDHRNSPAGYYNSVIFPWLGVWDMTASDFDSPFERLAFLYFPPQFRGRFFAVSIDLVTLRLKDFVHDYGLLLNFGLLGMISFFIPNRRSIAEKSGSMLLFLVLVISASFAITYDVHDYYVFYYPSFLVLGILAGLGVHRSVKAIMTAIKVPRVAPWVSGIFCGMVLSISFYGSLSYAWRNQIPPGLDTWDKYSFQFPAANRLKSERTVAIVEDDAIVFTNWNRLYSLYYVAVVIHGRLDMDFHQTYPQENDHRIADTLIDYIESNIDERPIYFTMYPFPLLDRYSVSSVRPDLFRIEKK